MVARTIHVVEILFPTSYFTRTGSAGQTYMRFEQQFKLFIITFQANLFYIFVATDAHTFITFYLKSNTLHPNIHIKEHQFKNTYIPFYPIAFSI